MDTDGSTTGRIHILPGLSFWSAAKNPRAFNAIGDGAPVDSSQAQNDKALGNEKCSLAANELLRFGGRIAVMHHKKIHIS